MADPVQTPRVSALAQLAKQLPVQNNRFLKAQKNAQDFQLQQAVAANPQPQNIQTAASQMGSALAGNAGQSAAAGAGQVLKQTQQVQGIAQSETNRAGAERVSSLQAGAREQQMDEAQKLSRISEQAKNELWDKQMQFQKDEAGRALFNDRQIADYARLKAQSDEEFRGYQAQMERATQRNLAAMEQAHKVILSDLDQQYQEARQRGDQQAQQDILNQKKEADAAMQREQARAANRAAVANAVGTVLGGAAGAIITQSPEGASAGASIGSGLGQAASST